MLHRSGKALSDHEHILWTSTIRVLSIAHHLCQMLSVLTWRSCSHLHDAHDTPYVVPIEAANRCQHAVSLVRALHVRAQPPHPGGSTTQACGLFSKRQL